MRISVLSSHPIQYYAPLFRALARHCDLDVYFAHQASGAQQGAAGFGKSFEWDVDLTSGYRHRFLPNAASDPGVHHFNGCDTPSIDQCIVKGRVDALVVTGWNLKTYWQGVMAAKRAGIPVLVRGDSQLLTPRSPWKLAAKRVLYPPLLRLFDGALYVGQRNFEYWRHYGYPKARLFFSPHCVDNAFFAERANLAARQALRARLGIGDTTPLALFAGKFQRLKRPQDLINAARLLRAGGVDLHLLFAGSGELETALAELAATTGVPCFFLGFQNQSEMPYAYAASDVLVLPSDQETWGLVVNEALASGRQAVASSACGCARELLQDERVGRVTPVGDLNALAQAIGGLLNSPRDSAALQAKINCYSPTAAAAGIVEGALSLRKLEH